MSEPAVEDEKARKGIARYALALVPLAVFAVIAGTAYGLSPYFRMSIATSLEIIEDGCRRIAKAVAELR